MLRYTTVVRPGVVAYRPPVRADAPVAARPSSHRPMLFSERNAWLDLARGASALVVAAGHLRLATLCGYADIPSPTPFHTAFYFATGLSSQAVMVFFVLSGMLVGGSAVRLGERFRLGDYLLSRLVRLWVPLLPALLFTLAVDAVNLAGAPQLADGAFHERWTSGPEPGRFSLSPVTFLGNLAFVNTWLVPSYGTNGVLWTLACEGWYYLTFPLLARAAGVIGPRRGWVPRAAAGAAAVCILSQMWSTMAGGFAVWLFGVGAAMLADRSAPPRWWLTTAAAGGFILSLLYSKLDYYGVTQLVPSRYVVGLAFAALAVQLVRLPSPGGVVRWLAFTAADISYSFYLTHFPPTLLIATRLYAGDRHPPTPADAAVLAGWYAGLVAVGWLFWWLFERHTGRVRAWVKGLLKAAPAASEKELPRRDESALTANGPGRGG